MKSPLVFFHGWGTTSAVWRAQMAYFFPKWPLMAPDYLLRDSDFSSFFSKPHTLKNLVEGFFKFCKHYRLSSLHLIGWSLGSMIALEFTSRFSSLVSSLTLVGGTPKFLSDGSFPYGLTEGELRLLRKRLIKDRIVAFTTFHQLLFTDQEKDRQIILKIRDMLKSNKDIDDQALIEGLNILESTDLRSILSSIAIPVLIIHGEKDRVCPVQAGQFMHHKIPGSQIKIFPDCGHLPFLTQEREFNHILEDFLNSLGSS